MLGHILQGLRSIFWRKLGGKPCLLLQAVVLSLGPLEKRKNAMPFIIVVAQVQKLWLNSSTIKLQPSLFVLSPQIKKKQKKKKKKHPTQKKSICFSYKSHFHRKWLLSNTIFVNPWDCHSPTILQSKPTATIRSRLLQSIPKAHLAFQGRSG